MRVALGVTVWAKASSSRSIDGIGHYTQELYHHLGGLPIERRPIAFGSLARPMAEGVPIERFARYDVQALLSAATGWPFKNMDRRLADVDLVHATDHLTPKLAHRPVVATIMDAIPLSHPQWVNQHLRLLKNSLWRASARWADHVVTISEYSRREVSGHFGISENKISVTPLGVDARYYERLVGQDAEAVVQKYQLPERFFLFVGTLQPRKNLTRLLDAHAALPLVLRRDVPLVVVGRQGWDSEVVVRRLQAQQGQGELRWFQDVSDFEKRVLLQRSTALVFPSLLEGFGLPVLEGFASQTPVITANTTSLPEVAGEAAWLVDPTDTVALTDALTQIVRDETARQQLVARGLTRARQFTWQACASATAAVYRQVLEGR